VIAAGPTAGVPSMTDRAAEVEALRSAYQAVLKRIAGACQRAGRDPGDVRLVAVSKTVAVGRLQAAVEAGITMLGENRVQEAEGKIASVAGAQWHLVGPLQKNKARRALETFDVIQTVDSVALAERLDRLAREVRSAGPAARYPVLLQVNVDDDPSKAGLVPDDLPAALEAMGPLDALVHNAATGVIRPALETEDKHFDWTLGANARALVSLARAAVPSMPPGSSIVGLSSLGSTRVLDNYVLVGASKAALEAIVRYLAVELAPRGIRVNAVSAGVVETDALDVFPNREQMLELAAARTPAGRLVQPRDVADAVCFLCTPQAEMIRGQTLIVDGGFSLLA